MNIRNVQVNYIGKKVTCKNSICALHHIVISEEYETQQNTKSQVSKAC